MFTANTPYYQTQAVRRMLADKGIKTVARPFYGYDLAVNLPNGNFGTIGRDSFVFSADSYFLWFSTHHLQSTEAFVRGVYNPPPVDAEPFGDPTGGEVQMRILPTGRLLHTPDFIPIAFCDWRHAFPAAGVAGDSVTPMTVFDSFAGGNQTGSHGFRMTWPEPILFAPSDSVEFQVRAARPGAVWNRLGHLFTLCGVKLFPGSA